MVCIRVTVRKEIDVTEPINGRRLSALNNIIVGYKLSISNSKFFMSKRNKREKERKLKRINREETVKMVLLTRMYQELTLDKTLKSKGKHTKSITISINAKYKDVIYI